MNGRGPRAWQHHWLLIPLHDRGGRLVGVIWVDEPEDRLLPSTQRLQALRLFANQAATAVSSASQFEEMRFLADHDPLTRLGNRRAFIRRLGLEVDRTGRYERSFALVLCDVDDFKALNDRHGHMAGDEALVRIGQVLRDALRRSDGAFRLGGDEFALMLVESGREEARDVVERIIEGLAAIEGGRPGGLRASFGVAVAAGGSRRSGLAAARGRRGDVRGQARRRPAPLRLTRRARHLASRTWFSRSATGCPPRW